MPVIIWLVFLYQLLCVSSAAPLTYPSRELANVTVIDTPILRAAQAFAHRILGPEAYSHVVRSWLFGALLIQNNASYATVDLEVHAVAALLHDLGGDQSENSTLVSLDKRFEVDGAIASRNFIRAHPDGQFWDERRVQLVCDAIALHAQRDIGGYKELEVQATGIGIAMDFLGPTTGVPQAGFDAVVHAFPQEGFKEAGNACMTWLCRIKPLAEVDTWQQPWEEKYVEGYKDMIKGKRFFDYMYAKLP